MVCFTIQSNEIGEFNEQESATVYEEDADYRPTETAIGTDGTIYVADGYGSYYVLRYDSDGNFVDKFGGRGNADEQLQEPHGVAVDTRSSGTPTCL